MPGDFKGTLFQKNVIGSYILAYDEQFIQFIFWLSLKQKLLYAYTEKYAQRQNKYRKYVYLS
jgi:hypothetical protein